ncbi:MAG: Crp/Fnr family transcriptional regulator [Flavobacteriales bacterium]|jgi:CRP-like cAMP-binding protein|nr:Crp/Fnr family transcriptional regulator [Flavobacteriales bacterium]
MREYLESFNLLTEEEIKTALNLTKSKSLKKGDFFIREGKTTNEVAFIVSGIFRSFYHSSSGDEVTYCFTFENSFMTAYSSFITENPTSENIQAISDAELLLIPKSAIKELENNSMNWLKLLKHLAEQEFVKMEQRIFLLQKENSEKRYRDLLNNHPEYLKQIPLNYLASYLGVSQRHLSRIRGTISN